jgi:hypothetical protein
VYAVRNASLWKRENVSKWLFCCVAELVQSTSSGTIQKDHLGTYSKVYAALTSAPTSLDQNWSVARYADANPADFQENVPVFVPGNANPIDPNLNDPAYMFSGAIRFKKFMDADGQFLFPVPDPYVFVASSRKGRRQRGRGGRGEGSGSSEGSGSDEDAEGAGAVRFRFGRNQWGHQVNRHHHAPVDSNIDFNLPLMQLFIATLFPWIFVKPLPKA